MYPQNRQNEPQFEKTNIFNLLLNDINKTHSEFKYKYIVYVHVFVQGGVFLSDKVLPGYRRHL